MSRRAQVCAESMCSCRLAPRNIVYHSEHVVPYKQEIKRDLDVAGEVADEMDHQRPQLPQRPPLRIQRMRQRAFQGLQPALQQVVNQHHGH